MRNILRQPRYFDDDYEAAALRCFRCGQGGHREAECTLPAKKKACHLCGFTSHIARDCPHGLCFNCLTPGHQSRDCPYQRGSGRDAQKLCCLRCGKSGHVVADCVYRFDASDLAQIHCYVCGSFGHLCCAPARLAASWTTKLLSMRRRGAPGPRVRALEEDSAVAVPPNSHVSTAASAVTSLASVRRARGPSAQPPVDFSRAPRKPSPWVREARAEAGVGEAAADEDTAVDRLPVHREDTPKSTADRGGDRRTPAPIGGGGGRARGWGGAPPPPPPEGGQRRRW